MATDSASTVRVAVVSDTHGYICPDVLAAGRIRNHGGPSCLVLHASPDSWEIEAFRFPEPDVLY